VTPGESALAQGVGFQRDQRPRPAAHTALPFASRMDMLASYTSSLRPHTLVDSGDMLLRMMESKELGELAGYASRLRCQYLYFCTSNVSICTFVLVHSHLSAHELSGYASRLRCQYLFFCSSNVSVCTFVLLYILISPSHELAGYASRLRCQYFFICTSNASICTLVLVHSHLSDSRA
jgi:hypothetical protein